jgi:hydrogenase-4 component E
MSAEAVVETCSTAIVLLGIALAATRSIGRSIWLLALQSALVGLAAVAVGLAEDIDHLVVGGLLAVGAKTIVIPAILLAMLRGSPVRVERHLLLGPRAGLVLAAAIAFGSAAAVSGIALPLSVGGERALPAAIASVLTGLVLVMTRRKAVSMLIGLFVFENGLALAAFALTFGMPLVVELGILFDLLIAVGVGWVTTRRMLAVFGSASTDHLRKLRG